MSPERKENPFIFVESFDSLKIQIIDALRRSNGRLATIASFNHGSLNLHENGSWSTWLETVKQDIVVKPNGANWVLLAYMLVKHPAHYLEELEKLNRLDNFDRTDIELVASNEAKRNLQKEFIGTMEDALLRMTLPKRNKGKKDKY